MEKISFYQQAFLRSAEKLLGAEAETRKMLERLEWEKAEAVAKKIVGKSIYDIHRELRELKNNLHLVYDLQWSYSLQDITGSDFLSRGLRAVANLC